MERQSSGDGKSEVHQDMHNNGNNEKTSEDETEDIRPVRLQHDA